MICFLSARRLKHEAYDDFRRAWEPQRWPAEAIRAYHLRGQDDENLVVSFGLYEGSLADRERIRDGHGDDAGRLERIAEHVEECARRLNLLDYLEHPLEEGLVAASNKTVPIPHTSAAGRREPVFDDPKADEPDDLATNERFEESDYPQLMGSARRPDELRALPDELTDLIVACLAPEAHRRPGVPELLSAVEPVAELRPGERRHGRTRG